MEKDLHHLQKEIYEIYKGNNGKLPSFRELAKTVRVSSTNTIHYHINQLKRKGYLNLSNENNGIVEFNLKNILGLDTKSGIYVLLENKKPFLVEETDNIKNNILEKLLNDKNFSDKIKNNFEKISIAYYLIEDENKRKELKEYLVEFYKL